jgi:hypothetical protein
MNGITRVLISLFLLGACAVAMRFTMYNVDLPHTKPKLHTARLDTSKATKIDLQIYCPDMANFQIRAGEPKRIAGTYQATDASELRIQESEPQLGKKDINAVSYQTSLRSYLGFFLGRPRTTGSGELRLPKDIPLNIQLVFDNWDNTHVTASVDLQGLNVQDFSLRSGDIQAMDLNLKMPQNNPKTRFSIRNDMGFTRVYFDQTNQGVMSIESKNGLVDVRFTPQTSLNVFIIGKAPNAQAFRQRVPFSSLNPKIVWDEPKAIQNLEKEGWYISGKTKNATQNSFSLEIRLGESAQVIL